MSLRSLAAIVISSGMLASGAEPDGKTTQELIQQLGSPDFREREKAHRALSGKTDHDSIDQLLKAMQSDDLEVFRRAQLILRPYLAIQREKTIMERMQKIRGSLQGKFPWINHDRVGSEIAQFYMDHADGPSCWPDWKRYRNATELMILNLLKCNEPVEELIERLKESELRWIEDYNQNANNKKIPPTWKK